MIPAALSFPIEDSILVFGLAMTVFLVAPLVLDRYRLPGIIGVIVVGAAIGPNGLGVLERDATIVLLGEVGIVYLMFVAGLVRRLREVDESSLVVPMSARRGTMGWQPALRTLPTTVAELTDGNFVVIYPSVGDRGDDRQFLQFR